MFKVGDLIQLSLFGCNTYKVISIYNKCYELEVVDFYAPEDIGDGIMTYGLGHVVWISSFMNHLFKTV